MEEKELEILLYFVTFILLILGVFILAVFFLYKRKQRLNHRRISELNEELLHTQLEIQEQTLQNISQEIHDNIGQVLSLAKLNLGTISIPQAKSLQDKIDTSRNLVAKAIQDLRDLSKSLNTDYVTEMGFQKSAAYQLEMISKSVDAQTSFQTIGIPFKLPAQKELILFRILQESLNNIIKHASCKNIEVSLNFEPNVFILVVRDDGKGFDASPLSTTAHAFGLGLRSMRNRSKLIGADLQLSSILGKGTTVTITLPLATPKTEDYAKK